MQPGQGIEKLRQIDCYGVLNSEELFRVSRKTHVWHMYLERSRGFLFSGSTGDTPAGD